MIKIRYIAAGFCRVCFGLRFFLIASGDVKSFGNESRNRNRTRTRTRAGSRYGRMRMEMKMQMEIVCDGMVWDGMGWDWPIKMYLHVH